MPKTKSVKKRAPSSSAIGRMELMFEDVTHKFGYLSEGLTSLRSETHRMFGDLQHSLSHRMEVLESVVRQNSADIRTLTTRVERNSEDIQALSARVSKNSEDIRKNSEDIQSLSARMDAFSLELANKADVSRVERLEAALG